MVMSTSLLHRIIYSQFTVSSGETESGDLAANALDMLRTDAVDAFVVAFVVVVLIVSLCSTIEPPIAFANRNVDKKL